MVVEVEVVVDVDVVVILGGSGVASFLGVVADFPKRELIENGFLVPSVMIRLCRLRRLMLLEVVVGTDHGLVEDVAPTLLWLRGVKEYEEVW